MIKRSGGPASTGIARHGRMHAFGMLLSKGLWNGSTRSRGRTREAPRESVGRGCLSGVTRLGKCTGFVGDTCLPQEQRSEGFKAEEDAGYCVDDNSEQVTGCAFGCWL